MEWTTHALSGVTLGYMVTNDWKLALVSGVFAVVPDLDEPRSKFGKPFFFISVPLNGFFGHRTFTHSLLFIGIVGIITAFINLSLSLTSMVGILAHTVGDMVTGKVQFLYPYNKKIGLKVSRFNYLLIDRITRLATLSFICFMCYQEIQHLL